MLLTWFSYSGAILMGILHYTFILFINLIIKRPKATKILVTIVLASFIIFPNLFYWTFQPEKITGRFNQVSMFSGKGSQLILEEQIREDGAGGSYSVVLTRGFHNKIINFSQEFFNNYAQYFSGKFLFGQDQLPLRYKIPNSGIVYYLDIPLFLIGLWVVLKKITWQKIFVLFWLLVGPIPASLTVEDVPNMQRAIFMLPAWQIITALGIYTIFNLRIFAKVKFPLVGVVTLIYIYQLTLFMHQLFIHQPRHRNWYRNAEWREAVNLIDNLSGNYSKIVMTQGGTEPHYYLMFYSQKYRKAFENDTTYPKRRNLKDSWSLGKYFYSQADCPVGKLEEIELDTLYIVGQNCLITGKLRILGEARISDGVTKLTFVDKPATE